MEGTTAVTVHYGDREVTLYRDNQRSDVYYSGPDRVPSYYRGTLSIKTEHIERVLERHQLSRDRLRDRRGIIMYYTVTVPPGADPIEYANKLRADPDVLEAYPILSSAMVH